MRRAMFALLLVAGHAHAAEPLARLFYTPAERAALERGVSPAGSEASPRTGTGSELTAAPSPSAPIVLRRLVLRGLVERDRGPGVAWLGDTSFEDGTYWGEYRVRVLRDRVRLVAADGRVRTLRVGQWLNLDTGEVETPVPPHALQVEVSR